VQLVFHLQQLVALALHHLGHRNAGGTADHLGDFLGADLGAQQLAAGPPGLFLGLGFLAAAFPAGSLPYCSSATLLKSPLRLSSSIWANGRSSLICRALGLAFSAFQISSRSAYSRCSFDFLLDQRRRFCEPRPFPS
jgi:hypothetical protein